MAGTQRSTKTPLIGLVLVVVAMAIVAATAYYDIGWTSILAYGLAVIVAILGFTFTFRDAS